MIDAVGTLSVSNTNLRANAQAVVVSAAASATGTSAGGFVSSYIRVDNLQNIAILEVREADTGEVLQQFPSKFQIQAFQRAEQLQQVREQRTADIAPSSTGGAEPSVDISIGDGTSPAPQVVNTAPSAPAPAPVAAGTSGSASIIV